MKICQVLTQHNYQAYIVGGCVRDILLGTKPKDFDICTDCSPQRIMEIFPKTIPTGLQHGTVTVCMGDGVENHFEVTTFRVEGEYLDGRRPEQVKFVNNITEDLARRDLTINAMAYDPVNHIGCDPFNGWQDLQDHIIRAVGNPVERFQEDGLRIMRVARFAARFNYQVEPNTLQGMKDSIETLKKVSKERISDELRKILMSKKSTYGLLILSKCGALPIICPILAQGQGTITDECQGELETKLALLYSKHPVQSVEKELNSLKMSNKEIKRVVFLLHTAEHYLRWVNGEVSYPTFMARIKNDAPDHWEHTLKQFIELTEAVGLPAKALLYIYQGVIVYARKELAINGDDLIAQGVKPGPNLKILLDSCYSEVLERPKNNNKEYLLQFCLSIV